MKIIHNLPLYQDVMGQSVTTPVLRVGNGYPHVVMVALQHGWEIIGLDTALQVLHNIHPTGTITLISVANPLAYQDGFRLAGNHMRPSAGQLANMNRVHPGRADGNVAERCAFTINHYIEKLKPDYLIDLHSYAAQSVPHGIVDNCQPRLQKQIENWLQQSQIPWYREYEEDVLTNQQLDRALSAIWVDRKVPAITLELGPVNLFSPSQSRLSQQTLTNVLVACSVLEGNIEPQIPETMAGRIWQRLDITYSGNQAGYLRPLVSSLSDVSIGDVLAEVVTPDGQVVGTINAPVSGIHFIWDDEFRVMAGSALGIMLKPARS
jgi:predicted deacylase